MMMHFFTIFFFLCCLCLLCFFFWREEFVKCPNIEAAIYTHLACQRTLQLSNDQELRRSPHIRVKLLVISFIGYQIRNFYFIFFPVCFEDLFTQCLKPRKMEKTNSNKRKKCNNPLRIAYIDHSKERERKMVIF
jgi:hypothetical protein